MVTPLQRITTLRSVVNQYQFFLFDQYGVLHNGTHAYPGMLLQLQYLKREGRTVGVISNSGKRADVNAERLSRFGFDRHLIDRVWTSGELAWQTIYANIQCGSTGKNLKVFYLGNDQDRSALSGLLVHEVTKPEHADLILIAGVGQTKQLRHDYQALFQTAANRGVPAYCTNPDLVSFFDNGRIGKGPGAIAQLYQSLGGMCTFFGKPHVEIYKQIFRDSGFQPSETLCVGDSLEHDIKGAASANCDSVLVSSGIYEQLSNEEFQAKLDAAERLPSYIFGDRKVMQD